jgi:hypothetical protein
VENWLIGIGVLLIPVASSPILPAAVSHRTWPVQKPTRTAA